MEIITFDDGSFIKVEKSLNKEQHVTVIMCGVNEDGNKLTMSVSDLNPEQVIKLSMALNKILNDVTQG